MHVKLIYRYFQHSGLPSFIDAIDVTQIPVKSPSGENVVKCFAMEKAFYQLMCKQRLTDGCFIDVAYRWPVSTFDSTILTIRDCVDLEVGNINDILLADQGDQCRRYLMRYFLNTITACQRQLPWYNKTQSRCRGNFVVLDA